MSRCTLLLALTLTACGAPSNSAPDLGSDLAMLAPYAGPLTLPVRTNISWDGAPGEGPLSAAHFTDGRGTVRFDDVTYPAFVYRKIPFDPYTLAAIVATTADGLLVAYAYCQNGGVTALYSETLIQSTTPQDQVATPGSCAFIDSPSDGEVALLRPGALAFGALDDSADVTGARLNVHGGGGTITIDGIDYALKVFTGVDCSKCGGAGWQELHVTLQHDDTLAFAILYLAADKPSTVQLAYGFRFDRPALWPPDQSLTASWTLK